MLHITNSALSRLAVMLQSSSEDSAVRIIERNGRFKLRNDFFRSGDSKFGLGGRTVLVLDAQLSGTLSRRTLDTHQTGRGQRLLLRRSRDANGSA